MTIRLYDDDSFLKTFEALTVSSRKTEKGYETVLDRTAFFPEGGGQTGDTGVLSFGETSVRVLDTYEAAGEVVHLTDGPVPENTRVTGTLDWSVRFHKMQNHSAEHIVSGLVCGQYPYHNVGFHLGDGLVTMDYDGFLSREQLRQIEKRANEIITEDLPIKTGYPANVAEIAYRSKLDLKEHIRLVEIPGVDICACCAPHVKTTGQIGCLKILSSQKYKSGVRITMQAGAWAEETAAKAWAALETIASLVSLPPLETVAGVEKLKEKLAETEAKARETSLKMLESLIRTGNQRYAIVEDRALLKDAVNLLKEKYPGETAMALAGDDETGYQFMLLTPQDLNEVRKVLASFGGSGGGRDGLLQGKITCTEKEIEKLLSLIENQNEMQK